VSIARLKRAARMINSRHGIRCTIARNGAQLAACCVLVDEMAGEGGEFGPVVGAITVADVAVCDLSSSAGGVLKRGDAIAADDGTGRSWTVEEQLSDDGVMLRARLR
jgi:hypothetical protein